MTHLGLESSATRERLDTIGWGLVFLLIGALALPSGPVEYAAVAVVGALMLGFNVVLKASRGHFDVFTGALGATALGAGIGALAGVEIDAFALFFSLLGVVLVIVPLGRLIAGRRQSREAARG